MQKLINLITIVIFIMLILYFIKKMSDAIKAKLNITINLATIVREYIRKRHKSKAAKGIIKLIKLPYKHYPEGTKADAIFNDYYLKLNEGAEAGFTPIMVRCDLPLLDYLKSIRKHYDADEIIKRSKKSRALGKKILDRRFMLNFYENRRNYSINLEELTGKKVKGYPMHFNAINTFNGSGEVLETIMFEVPTKKPWEVFAYVPFCTDEDFPNPNELLKIGKHWYERYGAMPSIIGINTLEMFLFEPVKKDYSFEAAKEIFALLPDSVNRACESRTLMELASILEVSYVWFFFWDQSNLNRLLNDILVKELWRRKKK